MFLIALIGFLFNLADYNFFRQLNKISRLEFPSVLDEIAIFNTRIDNMVTSINFNVASPSFVNVNNIADFFKNVGSFFAYLGKWLESICNVIVVGFSFIAETFILFGVIIKDIFLDFFYIIYSFLLLCGFPLSY